MIWRILAHLSLSSAVTVPRLLVGILLVGKVSEVDHKAAFATPVESVDAAERSLQKPDAQNSPTLNSAIATVQPELIEHQPAFSSQSKLGLIALQTPTPSLTTDAEAQITSPELAQNPNSNTEPLPVIDPLPSEKPSVQPVPTSDPRPTVGDRPIAVKQINITGSSIFNQADFAPILAKLQGKTLNLSQIENAADQVTQLYLEGGHITSRAVVVETSLSSGNIEIRVIEGMVDKINIQGTNRLSNDYIGDRLRLGTVAPLNTSKLEDQLRLLKLNPNIENIEATLKAGEKAGQSDLDIVVTEADSFSLNLGTDNYSPASVGSERMTLDITQENLTGSGDRLGLGYIRTTRGGADSLDISYTKPINAKDRTITLRSVFSRNEVVQAPFDVLNIRGESDRYELSYRQPIIRNPREELTLGVSFTYQDGLTFLGNELFGFNIGTEDGRSTTSIFKFTQEYTKRQPASAWSLRSQFSLGTSLFDATTNDEPIPDGLFWSWLGQAQKVKLINPNNLLIIQADLQLTPDSLLPSQQFVIGGGQSLRGFRQNARSADNGLRFSIEDRITLARDEAGDAVFLVAPFVDMGTVWNSGNNPNQLPNQTFLAGAGIGTWWKIEEGLTVRLDYGIPLVDLDDRGENIQDRGLYFNVNYLF